MKYLSILPIALTLGMPLSAQENVVITFADGTTRTMSFDEVPELSGTQPTGGLPEPVIAEPIPPGVSVTSDDTGIIAEVMLPLVYGQNNDTSVLGEDNSQPAIGGPPTTGVTVVIADPSPPPPPSPPSPSIEEMTFPGMNFETNKYAITPEGMKRVEFVAQIMAKYPSLRIQITGHTDDVGSANQALSENRAKSFRQALMDHYGIDPSRIAWRGLGESQPTQSNAKEEGRYANRRIVITPL